MKRIFAFLSALNVLAACSPDGPPDPAKIAERAATLEPMDARLADIYAHSCKACHAIAGSGAPMSGDVSAWVPRLAKGEAALLGSVISGFQGMPAGGQCAYCTADDYRALIRFMSQKPAS
jgi:cytochrome c5